eukprot:TRINITY_DN4554_c0_g1_i1.p1 TRINITY_DN4554_c0_g1~~TRINITY_DN4554_c0_g1_i1.p1  ORF type:complete len:743 (+),score=272.21 TRINITY_DN4554_c0_g1_i1:174-2231(+)
MYNCAKLNLLFVGTPLDKKIRAIASYKKKILTASGNKVYMWKRGKIVASCDKHQAKISKMLVLGDYLITVDTTGLVITWDLNAHNATKAKTNGIIQFHSQFQVPTSILGEITVVMHPQTYINKIVIGTKKGSFHLWNINTKKMIYTFPGWGSAVTCIEQSTAVDVVAVGLADGTIALQNLKFDKTIMTFHSDAAISSISFHTKGEPIMVSANLRGEVATWNLEEKMLENVQKSMHEGGITSIQFLPQQPVFVTSGSDNALKMWVFGEIEAEIGRASRLLRFRSSHSAPPSIVKFYGDSGHNMLTCGGTRQDPSFRFASTILDHLDRELSQGNVQSKSNKTGIAVSKLKFPPVIQFDAAALKELEWDNIITCHVNHPRAYTWSFMKLALGKHTFVSRDPNHQNSPLTSVAVSSCGNFGFVANIYGFIDKYNMQSGIHRGSCSIVPSNFQSMQVKRGCFAVKGMVVDILNQNLVACSSSGDLVFFELSTLKEKHRETVNLGGISFLRLQKESSMLAIVGENLSIHLYDLDSMRIVRKFTGHTAPINDLTFSADARWLVTCSNDCTVRVWDIVSGSMIDWMETASPAKSVAFSPKGDFFATTHVDSRHVYLWSNQAHFSHLCLRPIDTSKAARPTRVALPSATHDQHIEAAIDSTPAGFLPTAEEKAEEDEKRTAQMPTKVVLDVAED